MKLAFFPNGNVRVTSIYDLTTSFVFQPTKSGQHVRSSFGAQVSFEMADLLFVIGCEDAARRTGRRWSPGPPEFDGVLDREGGMYTWIHGQRDVGVL